MNVLIEATVVAAIVTGVFDAIISRKNGKLQHLTAERKVWRSEMRTISQKLSKSNKKNFRKNLVELKVRLNSYGRNRNINFDYDTHIWTLIKKIESKDIPETIFKIYQNLLINYLALLLKSDWERAKKEVLGERNKILSCILLLVSCSIYIYSIISYGIKEALFNNSYAIPLGVVIFILFILTYVVFSAPVENMIGSILCGYCRKRKEGSIGLVIGCYLLITIAAFGYIFVITFVTKRLYESVGINANSYSEGSLYYLAVYLLNAISAMLVYFYECSKITPKIEYYSGILQENSEAVDQIIDRIHKYSKKANDINSYVDYYDFLICSERFKKTNCGNCDKNCYGNVSERTRKTY